MSVTFKVTGLRESEKRMKDGGRVIASQMGAVVAVGQHPDSDISNADLMRAHAKKQKHRPGRNIMAITEKIREGILKDILRTVTRIANGDVVGARMEMLVKETYLRRAEAVLKRWLQNWRAQRHVPWAGNAAMTIGKGYKMDKLSPAYARAKKRRFGTKKILDATGVMLGSLKALTAPATDQKSTERLHG